MMMMQITPLFFSAFYDSKCSSHASSSELKLRVSKILLILHMDCPMSFGWDRGNGCEIVTKRKEKRN